MDQFVEEVKTEPELDIEFIGIDPEDIALYSNKEILEQNYIDDEVDEEEEVIDTTITESKQPKLNKLQCEICKKVLSSNQSLRGHLRMHSGNFFNCDYCSKKFTRKWDLKIHHKIHTGDQVFKCSFCPKTYARKCLYQDHLKAAHEDLSAAFLNQTSNDNKSVKSHKRRQNKSVNCQPKKMTKRLKCPVCSAEFVDEFRLNRHLNGHIELSAVKNGFECKVCKKVLASKYGLLGHIQRLHGKYYLDWD